MKEVKVEERQSLVELSEETKRETTERLVKQKALSQHRYLQTLIKKMAEARGYKAVIEAPTPDGKGRVDVSLERNGKRIACEIGMTTTTDWELHNIEKCLAAGYEIVVAVASDKRAMEIMQKQIIEKVDAKLQSRVLIMEADMLFHYLDAQVVKEVSAEKTIKGYRVKVEYDAISENEMKMKRESVTKFILDSSDKKK